MFCPATSQHAAICVHACWDMHASIRPLNFCGFNLTTFSDGWPPTSPHNWQKLYNVPFHCQTSNLTLHSLKPLDFYHSSLAIERLDIFIRRWTVHNSWKQTQERAKVSNGNIFAKSRHCRRVVPCCSVWACRFLLSACSKSHSYCTGGHSSCWAGLRSSSLS